MNTWKKINYRRVTSWSSSKPQMGVAHYNEYHFLTSARPEHTAANCTPTWSRTASLLLDWSSDALYCTTVVPKRSRDSVSDDVAFRRPAVELLVVTMHSWALPCHTKRAKRLGRSTSFRPEIWRRFPRRKVPKIPRGCSRIHHQFLAEIWFPPSFCRTFRSL